MKTIYKIIHYDIGVIDSKKQLVNNLNILNNITDKNVCIIFHFDDKLTADKTTLFNMEEGKIQHYAKNYIENSLANKQSTLNPFNKYLTKIIKCYPHIIKLLEDIVNDLNRYNNNTSFTFIILPILQ